MNNKPLIIVTNDDGIHAPGIRTLIHAVKDIGEIIVIAPDKPQSGMGHAITTNVPLRIKKMTINSHEEYILNGTPVDCIKFSNYLLKGRKPDLIVSGVNHGSNASINVIYSGTMAAVLEGAINNIPSIGFSLNEFSHDIDMSFTEKYIKKIAENVLVNGLQDYTALNVNIPFIKDNSLKGCKVCRQAQAYWKETFEEKIDPHKRPYYWLTGDYILTDDGKDTDQWALENGFIAIVPVQVDFTSYKSLSIIKNWNFDV